MRPQIRLRLWAASRVNANMRRPCQLCSPRNQFLTPLGPLHRQSTRTASSRQSPRPAFSVSFKSSTHIIFFAQPTATPPCANMELLSSGCPFVSIRTRPARLSSIAARPRHAHRRRGVRISVLLVERREACSLLRRGGGASAPPTRLYMPNGRSPSTSRRIVGLGPHPLQPGMSTLADPRLLKDPVSIAPASG